MLPSPNPHIQLAPRLLEHLAHLFHALERGGLAGGGGFGAGGAGGEEAFDALEKKRVDGLGPALAAKSPPLIGQHTMGNMQRVQNFGIGQQSAPSATPGVTSTGIKWSLQ